MLVLVNNQVNFCQSKLLIKLFFCNFFTEKFLNACWNESLESELGEIDQSDVRLLQVQRKIKVIVSRADVSQLTLIIITYYTKL